MAPIKVFTYTKKKNPLQMQGLLRTAYKTGHQIPCIAEVEKLAT